ncbi:MAG TPA: DNA repair protein RecN, partial [Stellaceae bacterium]|nr:DNA repair protein RecN [Stellaceae bacterium]
RYGAAQAVVSAEFWLAPDHPVRTLLTEAGLDAAEGDRLLLRRVVNADGRSRAFIDDQPASVGLLRQVGESLVEIQGQFESRGLLDPATHRAVLDAYGGGADLVNALEAAWRQWRERAAARREAETTLAKAREEEDLLRHQLAELEALAPEPGEEAVLAQQRALLMNREKLVEGVSAALAALSGNDHGGEQALNNALRGLHRLHDRGGALLDPTLAALERAAVELREGVALLEGALRALGPEGVSLESVEERLFSLRALARKHGVPVDGLAEFREKLAARLALLEDGSHEVARLQRAESEARAAYLEVSERVSAKRKVSGKALDAAVNKELPPLKLERARFATILTALREEEWGEFGRERVHFEVTTNPGQPPGPLAKIASGGELSRFMLALKVVLAKTSPVPTLVFDEVDSGIGGAVAASVGERLARLATELQVLVVTHSPQVAARGLHHWRVAKAQSTARTLTKVEELNAEERREEIARMLSGSAITAEARAAAVSLLTGTGT